MDSPGGGAPVNGVGGIFPCWKAAAGWREDNISIQTFHAQHQHCLTPQPVDNFCLKHSLSQSLCIRRDNAELHTRGGYNIPVSKKQNALTHAYCSHTIKHS